MCEVIFRCLIPFICRYVYLLLLFHKHSSLTSIATTFRFVSLFCYQSWAHEIFNLSHLCIQGIWWAAIANQTHDVCAFLYQLWNGDIELITTLLAAHTASGKNNGHRLTLLGFKVDIVVAAGIRFVRLNFSWVLRQALLHSLWMELIDR